MNEVQIVEVVFNSVPNDKFLAGPNWKHLQTTK